MQLARYILTYIKHAIAFLHIFSNAGVGRTYSTRAHYWWKNGGM